MAARSEAKQGDLMGGETVQVPVAAWEEMQARIEAMEGQLRQAQRLTRAQETRAADPVHEETMPDIYAEQMLLQHPVVQELVAGRPDMHFEWVRTHVRGAEDRASTMKAFRRGLRPVPAEAVDQDIRDALAVDFNDAAVLGVHGSILCWQPRGQFERRRAFLEQANRDQVASVQDDLRERIPGAVESRRVTVQRTPQAGAERRADWRGDQAGRAVALDDD